MTKAHPDTSKPAWPPRGLTGLLVRRIVPAGVDPAATDSRQRLGEFEGYLSTGISLVLSATKAFLGIFSGSVSLIADAANNAADIASSLVIALGCRFSRKPGDRKHPFGHGRLETVAMLVLAILLIGVSLEVASSGIRRLLHPEPCAAPPWLLAVLGGTVIVKAWMALFAWTIARASRSQVLDADAWNHIFDIASTGLVLLALFGTRIGWLSVDGWAALGVSGFIAWTGIRYTRAALNTLIGEAPTAADLARIRGLAAGVPGVRGVHDVIVHAYGDVRLISLHIEVDANLTVTAAHAMAEQAELRVAQVTGAKVIAHADPIDRSHPAYGEAEAFLQRMVDAHGHVSGFHDLRLTGPAGGYDLAVDVVLQPEVRSEDFRDEFDRLRDRLRAGLPAMRRIDIGIETEGGSEHEQRRLYAP
ncbi:MAG: cation diffusion facilitator family transporter [Verrucomicrobia bacterium]|nr:cation diffusion facilitator family transporter [Verrucomicrobiota bacterium]